MATGADLFIVVSAAGQLFGFRAREVLKVIEVGAVARVPRLPRAVVGITPYRGRIVTVVDLAMLLGCGAGTGDGHAGRRIVLLDTGSRNVGVLVDRVEVISTMDLVEPRRGVADDEIVREVATCGERTVGLIDGGRLARQIAGLGRTAVATRSSAGASAT
jgi:chemotaxis signal transduction protein